MGEQQNKDKLDEVEGGLQGVLDATNHASNLGLYILLKDLGDGQIGHPQPRPGEDDAGQHGANRNQVVYGDAAAALLLDVIGLGRRVCQCRFVVNSKRIKRSSYPLN